MEQPLWRNHEPRATRIWAFMQVVNDKHDLDLRDYHQLHAWSVENLAQFWSDVWDFVGIRASQSFDKVVDNHAPLFPRPDFFQGAKLNFAENLLYPPNIAIEPEGPALICATETTRQVISWRELRYDVERCSKALSSHGIRAGDCVAGFLGNTSHAVVAMLAATSIGAIWTGLSTDTGVAAVLDRLVQIRPVVLFADAGVTYNGRFHECLTKVMAIAKDLSHLKALVVFPTVHMPDTAVGDVKIHAGKAWLYDEFLGSVATDDAPLRYVQLPPSHPVYILYSSGTTGKPKCIIHSSIGTLIQHKKEHVLQCDLRPTDRLLYSTTCTWMLWHWLVSGLASGVTIVLYEGSPFSPHGNLSMPKLLQELSVTHFGTSAKYLSMLEQANVLPQHEGVDLDKLKAIYSTASPLAPSTFRYIYKAFPSSINLGSMTGGTDIISLFGAPCSILPVYAGEIQCSGLGMALQAYNPSGHAMKSGEAGDLVCVKPFPCQPVAFFGDENMTKYRSSYFETFPGVWHHGDFIKINTETGGLVMLGRSDGVLKPSGVRFGSAEIYNILLRHFSQQVDDALCIGRRRESDVDETVVLFLKLRPGVTLDDALRQSIKQAIRSDLSARHVPGVIDQCFEIPVTTNGKKIEVAVKQILCGMNIKTSASVANPESLDWYRQWAKRQL